MTPLVSIIVPVYNVEKYLKQCVDSLLNQTYQKIEILLIDDGSKDSSGKVCDSFARKYPIITAYHKKNSGLGLTRNYGLDRLNGDYVTFVDSDDYLEKDAIEKLVMGLENGKNDTVIGGFTKVTDKGKILYIESYPNKVVVDNDIYSKLFISMLGSSPSNHDSLKPSVWNTLFSVEIIKKYQLNFVSERQLISEDIVWDFDYYQLARRVRIINSSKYYYRTNPTSLSKTYRSNRYEMTINFFKYMLNKTKNKPNNNEAKLRLTKNLLINVRACFVQGSNRGINQIKKDIDLICADKTLQKAIREYPTSELQFPQKLFTMLISHKMVICLTFFAKFNLMA